MKLYQNLGIGTEERLLPGTVGYPFKIKSAKVLEQAFQGKGALFLDLRKSLGSKTGCSYGLIGKVHEEFKKDMNVGKIEELVGKTVIGYINKNQPVLQGISIVD